MPKTKFYAVRIGRQGPKIYSSWDDCKANVARYPGAEHKSFTARSEAEAWLQEFVSIARPSRASSHTAPYSRAALGPQPPQQHPQAVRTTSVELSPEQHHVLQRIRSGQSVFFTGSAGVGKSVLLREIISVCGGASSPTLAVTASTGIASVNIGGTTIHSWAGIGLGTEDPEKLASKFLFQEKFAPVKERWLRVETLIIDEISMLDGALFDALEYIARRVRKSQDPFGGITLVLSGDFFQLPPVPKQVEGVSVSSFAFEAQTWNRCIDKPIVLTKVFRQKDQKFIEILNAMRYGELKDNHCQVLKTLTRKVTYNDGIEPTELYPTRVEVHSANQTRLNQLTGSLRLYDASDYAGIDSNRDRTSPQKMASLLDRLLAPPRLGLKIGAQVMLVKNMVQGVLVNGSVGQVIDFKTTSEAREKILVPPDDFNLRDQAARWPLVRFIGGREALITPVKFTIENTYGDIEASRTQVPLILAWALSTHKSQGQTLERVKVDLRRVFEKGQAYVALSRATRMDQLQVLNFDPSRVMAHPKVLAWQRRMDKLKVFDQDFDDDAMDEDFARDEYHGGW